MDNTLQMLAHLATSITYDRVSPMVLHETKRRLIDFLGCAMGASRWIGVGCPPHGGVATANSAPPSRGTPIAPRQISPVLPMD